MHVADWCGPAEFVTEDCGFKVPVTNPYEMAVQICDILCDLDKNRSKARSMGIAACERIRTLNLRFPKGYNMRVITREALAAVEKELNSRPRKTLKYHRPIDYEHKFAA